ncbi:GMC oxidoreductase [Streptomyces sp. NPDC057565]|uniref:GMC oxidoreductase n=1 Tax=Streptomyces sp. NPDC057565 TaxID=3346169 RepID=UPI0036B544F4
MPQRRQPLVDPHLRVQGVPGLPVVDASVMPSNASGTTYTPTHAPTHPRTHAPTQPRSHAATS